MRCFALLGVLAGCNSIFGLEPTKVRDVDAIAPAPGTTRLSYLVGESAGVMPGGVTTTAIQPAPVVRAAALDGAFVDAPYGTDGTVFYPPELIGTRWRLEYTAAGELPHELQWSPGDGAGHAVVPLFGHVARTRALENTGFVLSMQVGVTSTTYMWQAPVVYTTGYWVMASAGASTTPSIDLHDTPPPSGDFGQPQEGDVVFAIDYTSVNNCRVSARGGSKLITQVQPGVMSTVELEEEGSSSSVVVGYEGATSSIDPTQQRLATALGTTRNVPDGNLARAVYARIAHPEMPAFTEELAGVPSPLMVPLADCPATVQTTPPARDIGNRVAYPKRVFAFAANTRMYEGVPLRSSIASIATGVGDNYKLAFPVQLAGAPKLDTTSLDTDIVEPLGDTPRDLTFDLEASPPGGPQLRTDYFEVVLYRIANPPEPVRVYVSATVPIRFDPRILAPGERYVFAIRTYRGRPSAIANDFTVVDPVQAVGTIFTGTFQR